MLGVHDEPVQRKILYPASPDPPLSVEDAHESAMVDVPVPIATTLVGVVGGEVSTVTVVVAVDVPFTFVAVSV